MPAETRHERLMGIKRKPTAWVVAGSIIAVDWVIKPMWDYYVQNETQAHLGTAAARAHFMSVLGSIAAYVPSSFGLGFAAGALIFAYWDSLNLAFRRHVLRNQQEPENEDEAPRIRAWLGNMVPHFDKGKPSEIALTLSILNCGEIPFRIGSIRGSITLSHDNGHGSRIRTVLPAPYVQDSKDFEKTVEPYYSVRFYIVQPIPRLVSDLMPDVFFWNVRPYFDFADLQVELVSDIAESKLLPLWESMRLTTGNWEVRADETFKLFKSEDEAKALTNSLEKISRFISRQD